MFLNKPSDEQIYSNEVVSTDCKIDTSLDNISSIDNQNLIEKELAELQEIIDKEEFNFIPEHVYSKLPPLLKNSTEIFLGNREKDIFLSGALAVLGGCFYNANAYNTGEGFSINPNIFMFVVAPPGSGKQSMMYSRNFAKQISKEFKRNGRIFDLPGNTSTAALLQILQKNEGAGILIESEIDTIVNAKKQEWGDYSDIIRVAFENGSFRYARKDSLFNEIEKLKFSISLSGTPNQFKTLIPTIENGLFSRGCYYFFNDEQYEYKPYGRYKTTTSINEIFDQLSNEVGSIHSSLLKFKNVNVHFSQTQLELITVIFGREEKEIEDIDLRANINRVFPITLKIATTLSILNLKTENLVADLNCNDDMLQIAILLAMTYLKHCYKAFDLIKNLKSIKLTRNQQKILSKLPTRFERKEAIEVCQDLNLAEKTIDNNIKKLVEKGSLNSPSHGKYEKVETDIELL
jgi:hypothetical protein